MGGLWSRFSSHASYRVIYLHIGDEQLLPLPWVSDFDVFTRTVRSTLDLSDEIQFTYVFQDSCMAEVTVRHQESFDVLVPMYVTVEPNIHVHFVICQLKYT